MNPFIYGEVVTGKDFCDRKEETHRLSRDLLNTQKVFLISSRRLGKTSLIKHVLGKINAQKVKTIYLDIEGSSTYKKFLDVYLNALAKEYTVAEKLYEFGKRFLGGIRFNLETDESGKPVFSLGYKSHDPNIEDIASNIYNLPEKISRGRRLVIVFDEFQEILKLDGGTIEAALRSVIQNQRNIGYVFAGSKRHLINEMATSPDRPFYKIGPVMYLDKINETEFEEYIFEKFKRTGIKISGNTIKEIIKITDNIPYYVQLLSHELWDYAIANKKKIEEESVKDIFMSLIKQYDNSFRETWERLIGTKRQLLQVIALKGGQNLLSKETLEENDLSYPSSVQKTLKLLTDDGYIDKIEGKHYIVDILFKEWIKKHTT
jgi:uncharacterized protein